MSNRLLSGGGGAFGGGAPPKSQPDSLISDDMIEFTLGVCEGPIGGLFDGPKSFYLDDTTLQSVAGEDNFVGFQLDVYHGDATASTIHNELGGITSNEAVNQALVSGVPVTRTTPTALRNKIDVIELRILFNQLVYNDSSGQQREKTADFDVEYRQAGTATWLPFFNSNPVQLKGKTSGGYVKEMRKTVPRISGDWELRVTKNSADGDPVNVVMMTWESFQCVESVDRAYNNLAVVKGMAKASDQFSSVPQFTGVWRGKLVQIPNNYNPVTRFYDGDWDGNFVLGHTDNPAWCAYDVAMNPSYGMKRHFPELIVDRFSVYAAGKWCDELVPRGDTGTFQPRYTYNDVIEEARPAREFLNYIVGIFGGVFVSNLNKTEVLKVDRPGTPVQIHGPESVAEGGYFSYQFSDVSQRPNDMLVSFINPDLGWETDVRQVLDEDYITKNGRIPEEFVAVGCLNPYEAQRRAYNRLLKANTEIMTVSYQVPRLGLALELYDIVGIADPDMNWGLSGRVKSVVGSNIYLRDSLFLPVNVPLTMSIQTTTGVQEITVRTLVANTKVLAIDSPDVFPTEAPSRAQFVITSAELGLVKPFRVVGLGRDTENPELYNIVGLEINTLRYSDVDNMTASPLVNYSGTLSTPPEMPIIQLLASGPGHHTIAVDGTLNSRIYVELRKTAGAVETEIFYARTDLDKFQSIKTKGLVANIPNVEVGVEYQIYAVAISATGRRSLASSLITHTVLGREVLPATPTGFVGIPGFDSVTLTGAPHPDPDFAAFKVYGANAISTDLTYIDTFTATRYVRRVPTSNTFTRYQISAVNRAGVESAKTGFINVLPSTVMDARGLNILDLSGNPVFSANGQVGTGAYITVSGSNVYLTELAAVSLIPALNFVGEFATEPTEVDLGDNWLQNAVYRNAVDGYLYVLTGDPLEWEIYLEDGRSFILVIESSNGNTFRQGEGQSTLLSARLFKNGAEVTDVTPASWFQWRRVSIIPQAPPNDDVTWNAAYATGYKSVNVDVDDVFARATFFCDIIST